MFVYSHFLTLKKRNKGMFAQAYSHELQNHVESVLISLPE